MGNKKTKKGEIKKEVVCSNCGSKFVYVLVDKQIVCRKCGHRTPQKE